MTSSRYRGSRLVDHAPDLTRIIRGILADLQKIRSAGRRETLTFTTYGASTGVACTGASLASTHLTLAYRSGDTLYADVIAGTGSGSIVGAALYVPDFALTGTEVQTASGGTERQVRVQLPFPDGWQSGDAHTVHLQARRVSGSDATTVRPLAAWQR